MCSVITGRAFLMPCRVTRTPLISPCGTIHVQQRALRQTFAENFPCEHGKARGFGEVEVLARHQTHGHARNAENRRFQRTRYSS
jgi:hypothetical protein